MTRRTHLELETEKSQTQVGRNLVSLTDISGNQTNLQEQHITASADHNFNRLNLKLTGTGWSGIKTNRINILPDGVRLFTGPPSAKISMRMVVDGEPKYSIGL